MFEGFMWHLDIWKYQPFLYGYEHLICFVTICYCIIRMSRNSKKKTKNPSSASKDIKEKPKGSRYDPDGVIGSFLAIFSFSFFVGLGLLHLILCIQHIHFDSWLSPIKSMEKLMAGYYGFEYIDMSKVDLRVNTSFYMH